MTTSFSQVDFESIGEKLRGQRFVRNEKITTVANAIGVSKKVISQVENGRYHSLKIAMLFALCAHLHVSPGELFPAAGQ